MLLKDVAIARSNGDPDTPLWNVYEQNFAEINEAKQIVKQIEKEIEALRNKMKHALECDFIIRLKSLSELSEISELSEPMHSDSVVGAVALE